MAEAKPIPPRKLMRRVGLMEMDRIAGGDAGMLEDLELVDLVTYGHFTKRQGGVGRLHAAGIETCDYLNVLNPEIEEWRGGGDPVADWLFDHLPHCADSSGRLARFPWFWNPRIYAWHLVDDTLMQRAAEVVLEHRRGESFFLDQAWTRLHAWMFDPRGAPLADLVGDVSLYHSRILTFVELLMSHGKEEGHADRAVFTNGDRMMPPPRYLEKVNRPGRWGRDASLWIRDPGRHVLEVDARALDYVAAAIHLQAIHGGWLAFDAGRDWAAESVAYRAAYVGRSQDSWSRMTDGLPPRSDPVDWDRDDVSPRGLEG